MALSADPSAALSFERASALCMVYFDWGTTVLTGREKNKTFPAFSSPANAERARPKSSDSRADIPASVQRKYICLLFESSNEYLNKQKTNFIRVRREKSKG